jgi:hypothetical protein
MSEAPEAAPATTEAAPSVSDASTSEAPVAVPVASALSESILSLVKPMVEKTDSSIQAAIDSQAQLSQQIDRVASELQTFLSVSQLPSFDAHVKRLSEVRRRTANVSGTLERVQARLTRIEALSSRLQAEESLTLSRTPQR